MRSIETKVVTASAVRRALTPAGDIRSDVAFQHDVNALLSRFEHLQMPWLPLGELHPATPGTPRAPRARKRERSGPLPSASPVTGEAQRRT
jgi:hypothetical protein